MKKHTIVALLQDRPGVLSRVIGLIRRRGYNIRVWLLAIVKPPV